MKAEYLIRGGTVIDGYASDTAPKKADIAIEGAFIKAVGDLSNLKADKVIDAEGLYICPGFIDVHAHSEFVLLADGRADGKVSQGITTEINGNCGLSAAPLLGPALEQREAELEGLNIRDRWSTLSEYYALLEKKGVAINFATLVGHGNIRASASGYVDRPLTDSEMIKSLELLDESMRLGAKGLSTGLIYPPGVYAESSEIVALARETASHNGIYTTHMRSEGDRLIESVDETIKVGHEAGIAVHISHLKTSGQNNWGKLEGVLESIERAIRESLMVTCDRYPYIASSTDLDTVLPSWAFEGGHKREIERLRNERERLEADLLKDHPDPNCWERVVVSSVTLQGNKWMEGKNLKDISISSGKSVAHTIFDLLVEENLDVGAIFFVMNEDNLRSILRLPFSMLGSDSSARSFDGISAKGKPHPRGFGSFPRVLGKYVREEGILSVSEAIHKMTGLPARTFRIDRRGIIAENYFADLTIFNPGKVIDRASFGEPFRRAEGIEYVFVNGTPAVYGGELTGSLSGRIVR